MILRIANPVRPVALLAFLIVSPAAAQGPPTVLPECASEGAAPDRNAPAALTARLKAEQLDVTAYRVAQAGLRVELCQASVKLAKRDGSAAQHIEQAKNYMAAVHLANNMFHHRSEVGRKACLQKNESAFKTIGELEGLDRDHRDAASKAHTHYIEMMKERDRWGAAIQETKQQVDRAIDDFNNKRSGFVGFFRSVFNDGSDRRERDEQVRALSDTISAYSAKVGRAMHEAARDAARERSAKDAIAQIQPRIQQANRQLGDLKTLLVELHKADDEVLEMGQAFVALEDKFAQLTVWVRDDPAAVRAAVDRVRSTIKAKAEAFARGAAIACSSVDLSR